MDKKRIIWAVIIILSGALYYLLAVKPLTFTVNVTRVIDGDTFVSDAGEVRLLGLNTPEKGNMYYDEAREFLEDIVLNKTVNIEIISGNERDKYGRILAYIFYGNIFVNKEILEKGYANLYYYESDKYTSQLADSEKLARENEARIWAKSGNYGCISIVEFVTSGDERIALENNCKEINITVKDDANHIYHETLKQGMFERSFSHVWNDEGDSLFIWDDRGLVLFYRY